MCVLNVVGKNLASLCHYAIRHPEVIRKFQLIWWFGSYLADLTRLLSHKIWPQNLFWVKSSLLPTKWGVKQISEVRTFGPAFEVFHWYWCKNDDLTMISVPYSWQSTYCWKVLKNVSNKKVKVFSFNFRWKIYPPSTPRDLLKTFPSQSPPWSDIYQNMIDFWWVFAPLYFWENLL